MNLTQVIKYIQTKIKEDQRVHNNTTDDVYNHWNNTNSAIQYPSVVLDYVNTSYNADTVDYQFIIYAGSVINEKQTNIYPLKSVADSIIQQVLHKIDVEDNEMDLVIPCTIIPFQQKFSDVLCGAYCSFSVRISADIICD